MPYLSPMDRDLAQHGSHFNVVVDIINTVDSQEYPYTKIIALVRDLQSKYEDARDRCVTAHETMLLQQREIESLNDLAADANYLREANDALSTECEELRTINAALSLHVEKLQNENRLLDDAHNNAVFDLERLRAENNNLRAWHGANEVALT